MSKYTEVVILCEDRQQEVFARHFLTECGVIKDRIRVRFRSGLGSGEQFVRQEYLKEVKAYRSRSHHLNIALAVFIDADTRSVRDRFRQLDDKLASESLPKRQPDEKIGVFIPKMSIETWIHYLQGETVNEVTAYSKFDKEGYCKPFVAELAENRHQPLPDHAPSSLKSACNELSRIL